MAANSSTTKRCLYAVLGIEMSSTPEEIRSAYRKLALQRHPDKLIKSGISEAEATAQFQELVHAYEVLSDAKERAWYDSHRSQILFSDSNSRNSSNSVVPDLFSYFSNTVFSGYSNTKKGFYKVYSEVFDKIYANELNYVKKLGLGAHLVKEAPIMGDLESPYTQATAFYNYWLGFGTVMDFVWVDEYDAMAGVNRKSRRVMEDENKKLRKKAKKEYNETVRGLAEFVKKRDKRVIDMAVKKKEEMEKKKEEEKERKRKAEKERMERLAAYEDPEWAQVEDDDDEEEDEGIFEEEKKDEAKELYCVACGKKFKSEKQWKNHEQSKKHKEKIAELRQSFVDEDEDEAERDHDFDDEFEDAKMDEEWGVEVDLDELDQKLKEGLEIGQEDSGKTVSESRGSDEDESVDVQVEIEDEVERDGSENKEGVEDNKDDDISMLEAMLSGRKNRKKNISLKADDESEDVMQYNNRKTTRRNRGGKKEKNKGGVVKAEVGKNVQDQKNENKEQEDDNAQPEEGLSVDSRVENESDDKSRENVSSSNHSLDKKGNNKIEQKEKNSKSKKTSKGKKVKHASNLCETCGEEFDTRNKLHKHLGETGHATLKQR
ncbi:hypothetical protein ACFE04_006621 [Oxalis oulophora]